MACSEAVWPACIRQSFRKQSILPKKEWREFLLARFSISLFAPARCDTTHGIFGLPYSRPTLLGGPTNCASAFTEANNRTDRRSAFMQTASDAWRPQASHIYHSAGLGRWYTSVKSEREDRSNIVVVGVVHESFAAESPRRKGRRVFFVFLWVTPRPPERIASRRAG